MLCRITHWNRQEEFTGFHQFSHFVVIVQRKLNQIYLHIFSFHFYTFAGVRFTDKWDRFTIFSFIHHSTKCKFLLLFQFVCHFVSHIDSLVYYTPPPRPQPTRSWLIRYVNWLFLMNLCTIQLSTFHRTRTYTNKEHCHRDLNKPYQHVANTLHVAFFSYRITFE